MAEMAEQEPVEAQEEVEEVEEAHIGRRCYVGNLAWRTSWQDLKDAFRECGTVVYANVMCDSTGEPFIFGGGGALRGSLPDLRDRYRPLQGLGHRGV